MRGPWLAHRENAVDPGQVRAWHLLEIAGFIVVEGWTQGGLAERKDGTPATPWETGACRWCATGALLLAHYRLTKAAPLRATRQFPALTGALEALAAVAHAAQGEVLPLTLILCHGFSPVPPASPAPLWQYVAQWNDDPRRTKAQVVGGLRAAGRTVPIPR